MRNPKRLSNQNEMQCSRSFSDFNWLQQLKIIIGIPFFVLAFYAVIKALDNYQAANGVQKQQLDETEPLVKEIQPNEPLSDFPETNSRFFSATTGPKWKVIFKRLFNTFNKILTWSEQRKIIFELPFFVITIYAALAALNTYQAANRVSTRQQLYETEQLISAREMDDPELMQLWFSPTEDQGVDARTHIERSLQLAMPNTDIGTIQTASELDEYLYGYTEVITADHKNVERLRLQAETYLYHTHNIFDHAQDKVISPEEADTWLDLIDVMAPHPIYINAVYGAYKNNWLSRAFAQELQRRILSDEWSKEVVKEFYPELLEKTWPDNLPSYEY